MSDGRKLFFTVLLVVVGLFGLGMTLCGGIFTGAALLDMAAARQGENYAPAMLVIAVPSLLGGAGVLWFVWRRLQQMKSLP
jgi:hypothetical protein